MTSEAQPGQEQRMDDLDARLRAKNTNGFTDLPSYRNPDGPEAADRLILYREAVVEAQKAIAGAQQVILGTWADEALAKIGAGDRRWL